jgi:ferritin-like metal-binding protein YciE
MSASFGWSPGAFPGGLVGKREPVSPRKAAGSRGTHVHDEGSDMKLMTLDDVFTEQLADLYSAERQLVQALPKVAGAAHTEELKKALDEHLEETRTHVTRLEEIFQHLPNTVDEEHCKAMEGLLAEGEEIVEADGDPTARDAALIAAAQRVEHYEIAAYGTAKTLAEQLGYDRAEELLKETLDEEANADKLLTKIATGGLFSGGVNEQAAN